MKTLVLLGVLVLFTTMAFAQVDVQFDQAINAVESNIAEFLRDTEEHTYRLNRIR